MYIMEDSNARNTRGHSFCLGNMLEGYEAHLIIVGHQFILVPFLTLTFTDRAAHALRVPWLHTLFLSSFRAFK